MSVMFKKRGQTIEARENKQDVERGEKIRLSPSSGKFTTLRWIIELEKKGKKQHHIREKHEEGGEN